jgi:hypothetical protein
MKVKIKCVQDVGSVLLLHIKQSISKLKYTLHDCVAVTVECMMEEKETAAMIMSTSITAMMMLILID